MLIDEANATRRLKGYGPKDWVYKGYGILQFDLQAIEEQRHEDFFRQRQWYSFEERLDRCLIELEEKHRIVGGDLWESVRAYNGAGPRARGYRDNVKEMFAWTSDEIAKMEGSATRSAPRATPSGPIVPAFKPQKTQADLAALLAPYQIDRTAHPLVIAGIRGYYRDTMGQPGTNDIGIYDDAIFLDAPHGIWQLQRQLRSLPAQTGLRNIRRHKGHGQSEARCLLCAQVRYPQWIVSRDLPALGRCDGDPGRQPAL